MSSPRRIGLPETIRMRHDTHFVDQLARPGGEAIGRLIPVEDIEPNPDQPRQALGDLAELTASIREKGILEPLLVRKVGGRFEIIAGERRYRAAIEAGLAELPCVIRESSDAEMMELALVENLQRKDLTRVRRGRRPQGARREVRRTPTRRWRRSWARVGRPSRKRCRSDRCRRRFDSSVDWPTFSLSPFFYR